MADYKTIDRIAADLPVWQVLAERFKGIDATITYPEGVETVEFPNGDGPSDETLAAARTNLAAELYARQHIGPRAAAFAQRPLGDQLDAIIKGLKAAQAAGVELPADTAALIAWSDDIKAAHPKPEITVAANG